ncbi:hypothetical protein GQ53DRAFT_746735 [Thozetella sp. PMI_491]|nr:hypothetical protein GQ53DRAFT_746735 [Thozetella sp. PMI_491]
MTTSYDYYGASPHSYISHRHALSHVPLGLRCFNSPTYELDRKVVVLVPRCGY